MLEDLRRALTLLDRGDRWRWAALVPLGLVVAALEAAGAGAVFLLVRVLADPSSAARLPRIARWIPGLAGVRPSPVLFALVVVAFYVARNIALVAVELAQERVVQRTASRIATRLLERYLHAPYEFHFRHPSSALLHAVRDSVDTVVENVLAAAVHIASELLVVAGLIALLAATAPRETVAIVVTVLLLLVAPIGATRRVYARWGEEEWKIGERMMTRLTQALGVVKTIVVSGRQDYFAGRFSAERAALERAKLRRVFATTTIRLGVETVFICAMLLAVVMLTVTGRTGPDAVSVLSLFAYAGFRVVPSANRIILQVNAMRFGRAFVGALTQDWRDVKDIRVDEGPSRAMPPLARAIELERVSYSYGDDRAHALSDVTVTIAHGTSVGIVGPTGAGKSTLVDLVLGLLVPTGGRVLVDGRDIAGSTRAWQAQVGYVPQELTILDDTLRRNVAFGVPDREIDDARVLAAVKAARLDALVASLPGGLDANMGERGNRMSGGERQRVAIARALYTNPAVLVFDEATSSLDRQTEREIVEAIEQLRGARTVLVIAHRLTTVRRCDRILVLDGGRLVADGRYDELLDRSDLFRSLALAGPDA